uniref:Uncharacterized protein n=1 Tax=Oncorhynchus tshawytscha TaxID=74940 RepID=A0A8C8C6K9_ONCTS
MSWFKPAQQRAPATLKMLQVKDCPPNIFECQLHLWTQWFESWSEEERNSFLHIPEERDRSLLSAGMEGYGRRGCRMDRQ